MNTCLGSASWWVGLDPVWGGRMCALCLQRKAWKAFAGLCNWQEAWGMLEILLTAWPLYRSRSP